MATATKKAAPKKAAPPKAAAPTKKAPAKKAAAPVKKAAAPATTATGLKPRKKAVAKPAVHDAKATPPVVEAEPKAPKPHTTDHVVPLEVEEVREPQRPYRKAVQVEKEAVIMLAWDPDMHGDDPRLPADRDFEGFDNHKEALAYFKAQVNWVKADVEAHGDLLHAIVLVEDRKSVV